MDAASLLEKINALQAKVTETTNEMSHDVGELLTIAKELVKKSDHSMADPLVIGLTVFLLACFVGYYVVWRVTPALHSPLMAVTNAISSVIIVGALIAAGPELSGPSTTFGFLAVVLASVNIFGGFIVTQRMLEMFSKNKG